MATSKKPVKKTAAKKVAQKSAVVDMREEVPDPPSDEVLIPDAVWTEAGVQGIEVDEDTYEDLAEELPEQNDQHSRRLKALTLRLSGATYGAIAQVLKVQVSTVKRDVAEAFKDISPDDAKTMRMIHHARLEQLLFKQWPAAMQGEIGATNTAMGIMDRIDRLYGLSNNPPEQEDDDEMGEFVIMSTSSKEDYIDKMRKARKALEKGGRG